MTMSKDEFKEAQGCSPLCVHVGVPKRFWGNENFSTYCQRQYGRKNGIFWTKWLDCANTSPSPTCAAGVPSFSEIKDSSTNKITTASALRWIRTNLGGRKRMPRPLVRFILDKWSSRAGNPWLSEMEWWSAITDFMPTVRGALRSDDSPAVRVCRELEMKCKKPSHGDVGGVASRIGGGDATMRTIASELSGLRGSEWTCGQNTVHKMLFTHSLKIESPLVKCRQVLVGAKLPFWEPTAMIRADFSGDSPSGFKNMDKSLLHKKFKMIKKSLDSIRNDSGKFDPNDARWEEETMATVWSAKWPLREKMSRSLILPQVCGTEEARGEEDMNLACDFYMETCKHVSCKLYLNTCDPKKSSPTCQTMIDECNKKIQLGLDATREGQDDSVDISRAKTDPQCIASSYTRLCPTKEDRVNKPDCKVLEDWKMKRGSTSKKQKGDRQRRRRMLQRDGAFS